MESSSALRCILIDDKDESVLMRRKSLHLPREQR